MSILEKLAERMKQRDLDASVRFAQLVQDIANGKEPTVESVEKILADAGKTRGPGPGSRSNADASTRATARRTQALIAAKEQILKDLDAAQAVLDRAQPHATNGKPCGAGLSNPRG